MPEVKAGDSYTKSYRITARFFVWLTKTLEISRTALTESNVVAHEVERSSTGGAFRSIGTIAAQNIATPDRYTFIDGAAAEGGSYYRFKTVSRSGSVVYSDVININTYRDQTNISILKNE